MEIRKGINVFIKDNVKGDVNTALRNVETLETFVHVAITKKDTAF